MATGIGVQGGFVGTGEEGTYGVEAPRDVFLFHNSESIRVNENKNFSGALYKVGRLSTRQVQGNVSVAGDVSWNPSHAHQSWTRMLKHALGSEVISQPDATGNPTVYWHTITPADHLPTGMTFEVGKDVLSTIFTGCKVTTLRMSGTAGGLMEASMSIIGKDGTTDLTPTVPTIAESEIITITNASLTWGGPELDVTNFDFSIENALTPRFFTNSRFTKEPLRNAKRRMSGSFRTELVDDAIWDDFRNATYKALVVNCVGSAINGAFSYGTQITCPIAQVLEGNANADTEGILTIAASFDAFIDDVEPNEMTILVTNESAT